MKLGALILVITLCSFNYLIEGAKEDSVLLATWNIQNFGPTKVTDQKKLKIIVKIIEMVGLIAIQEVSDVKGKAIETLIASLSKKLNFNYILSPRVGEGGYAEQYGFIYNENMFKLTNMGIYNGSEPFKRPPFFVTVESLIPGNPIKFGLGTIHTSPPEAVKETSSLADTADWYTFLTGNTNVMLLGDYNCGCDYVKVKDYGKISLYTRPEFRWLVPSCFDTTVALSTNCPYDRIVIRGDSLFDAIIPESTRVFDFGKKYKLSEKEALGVSDHFPVLLELKMATSSSNV